MFSERLLIVKRIALFLTVLALMFHLHFAVSADVAPSVTAKHAPQVVAVTDETGNAVSVSSISFLDVDSLTEEDGEIMRRAYTALVECADLTKFDRKIKTLAKKSGVTADDLIVSDFFDLSVSDDGEGSADDSYTVSIKVPALQRFVCLIHFVDGEWVVVEDAAVSEDGQHLSFSVSGFSPFAIVTATPDATVSDAPTAFLMRLVIGVLLFALVALTIALLYIKKFKKLLDKE